MLNLAENQAMISVGRELRKLVENNGTNLHWVKVKGHSGDVINDRADELASVGMHGKDKQGRTRKPRQLKYIDLATSCKNSETSPLRACSLC